MATITTSKITSRGQVTLPEAVRRRLRLGKGDRVEWQTTDGAAVLVR